MMRALILLAGGSTNGGPVKTILEYDITRDSYSQIGSMTQARDSHAISVVRYEDFSKWCVF